MHLICFIIRIYHDTRSCECQMQFNRTHRTHACVSNALVFTRTCYHVQDYLHCVSALFRVCLPSALLSFFALFIWSLFILHSSRSPSLSRVIVFLPPQCCMQQIKRHSLIAPSLLPTKMWPSWHSLQAYEQVRGHPVIANRFLQRQPLDILKIARHPTKTALLYWRRVVFLYLAWHQFSPFSCTYYIYTFHLNSNKF